MLAFFLSRGSMSWGKCPDCLTLTDHLKMPKGSNYIKTPASLLWGSWSKAGVPIILAMHIHPHLQSQGPGKTCSGRPSCYGLKKHPSPAACSTAQPLLAVPRRGTCACAALSPTSAMAGARLRAGVTGMLLTAQPGAGWLAWLGGRGRPATANLAELVC